MLALIIFGLIGFAIWLSLSSKVDVERVKRTKHTTITIDRTTETPVTKKVEVVEEHLPEPELPHDFDRTTGTSPVERAKQMASRFWDAIK